MRELLARSALISIVVAFSWLPAAAQTATPSSSPGSPTEPVTLNRTCHISSVRDVDTQRTLVGFSRDIGAQYRLFVYAALPQGHVDAAGRMYIEVDADDDEQKTYPATRSITLSVDNRNVPLPALKKIDTFQTTRHVTDIMVKPYVEKDVPMFVTRFTAPLPDTAFRALVAARNYKLTVDGHELPAVSGWAGPLYYRALDTELHRLQSPDAYQPVDCATFLSK